MGLITFFHLNENEQIWNSTMMGFHALTLDRSVNISERVRTGVLRAETLGGSFLQTEANSMRLRFLTLMLTLLLCSLFCCEARRAQRTPGPVDDLCGIVRETVTAQFFDFNTATTLISIFLVREVA